MLTPRDPRLIRFARANRKLPTISEDMLWHELRDQKLNGLKFRRQHPLHPFIVDFFCAKQKLIIEVDGDIHDVEHVKMHDASRQTNLESRGYRVLRFSHEEVMHQLDNVLASIATACGLGHPSPSPSPQGGGE